MKRSRNFEFDIALSFSGEDRKYVEQVANLLRLKGIKVFYDFFEEDKLWGKNLYEYLSNIYQNKARFTIMFISEHYNKKLWTSHERKAMQARAFQESEEYILPAKFDNTEIPGILGTIGYIDLNRKSPTELVDLIEKKLVFSGGTVPSESLRKALSTIRTLPKLEPLSTNVAVKNNNGEIIENAQVVLIADNATYLENITNNEGIGSFEVKTRRSYTVLIAHPEYPSTIFEKFDPINDLEITVNKVENIGSIIIHSTGYIPNFRGRLSPILDTGNRTYLYANNIAINGGENQPVTFKLNKPVNLEDSEGIIIDLIFRFIKGRTSLIDYIKPIFK